jgi:hypothetical protein
MYFGGLRPAGTESNRDCEESEGCSLDEGMVKAEVWTTEAVTANSPDQVLPPDAADRLVRRRATESRGTSLFSERTKRR